MFTGFFCTFAPRSGHKLLKMFAKNCSLITVR